MPPGSGGRMYRPMYEQTYEQTYERTYEHTEDLPIPQDLVPYWGRCPKTVMMITMMITTTMMMMIVTTIQSIF